MIYALKGYILEVKPSSIVIDVHDVFYEVLVAHAADFMVNEFAFVYTYQVKREDEDFLVGFRTIDEKQIFTDLITVKGIGPKTALGALSETTAEMMVKAIATSDIKYLKKLPGIGPKAASQIILDLQGKLMTENTLKTDEHGVVRDALRQLGFKVTEIDQVLKAVYVPGMKAEELLKLALQKLRK